jgi:hypothetical protein
MDRLQQIIRPSVVDHMLEPDALRGSEQFLRNVTDEDGAPIPVFDAEEARRKAQLDAAMTNEPLRMTAPESQTPVEEITPAYKRTSDMPNRQAFPTAQSSVTLPREEYDSLRDELARLRENRGSVEKNTPPASDTAPVKTEDATYTPIGNTLPTPTPESHTDPRVYSQDNPQVI